MTPRHILLVFLLTLAWLLFAMPLTLAADQLLSASEPLEALLLQISLGAGVVYLLLLGALAAHKNRSRLKWVGISLMTGPFGLVFSYPFILSVPSLNREKSIFRG